jgi:hypothetical protein
MTCTRRFLNFQWEHHRWRRRVTATHRVSIPVTEMWGRRSVVEDVRCHTEYVCDVCGKTRGGAECLCDAAKGDRCAVRREFLAATAAEPKHSTR